MPAVHPSDRAAIARIAALTRWAHEPDRAAATAPGRAAVDANLAAEIDPAGVLTLDELARRVGLARRARMTRLALASARARRARASIAAGGGRR